MLRMRANVGPRALHMLREAAAEALVQLQEFLPLGSICSVASEIIPSPRTPRPRSTEDALGLAMHISTCQSCQCNMLAFVPVMLKLLFA